MSTEAALLRAIRDAPDDDTARLVYADFVEEEGDPARGEFIRVQVALANTPEHDPRRRDLEDREHALLSEHEADWLGVPPTADGLVEWEFHRGFVDEVAATTSFMLNEGADVCAAHPLRRWRVQGTQQDMGEDLLEVGRRGWFARLEAIDLAGWFQSIGELERFLVRSDFTRLRELDLTDRPGLGELATVLERVPFRDQLKILRLGGRYPGAAVLPEVPDLVRALAVARLTELSVPACELAADDVRDLLAGACCRELTSLDISYNPIEPDGWNAFRGPACRLRELDLSGTPLGGISLDDVLRSGVLSELRSLNVSRCGSAMANIRALAASPFWAHAEELRMQGGTVPERALDPLFAAAGPPGLRVFDVSENFFRDAGVERLCAAPWAESLTWLGLSRNYLTDDAVQALADSGRFTRLRTLHLSGNIPDELEEAQPLDRITERGVRILAESPNLTALRVLTLDGIDVGAAALDALLNAPPRPLSGLGLSGCRLSADSIRVLAASPALARLEWLDLSRHRGRPNATLLPLAESEFLSPRCELDIRGCFLDDETRRALAARLGRRLSG